jgi:hypothetical protein
MIIFNGGLNVIMLYVLILVVSKLISDHIVISLSFDFSSKLLQIVNAKLLLLAQLITNN